MPPPHLPPRLTAPGPPGIKPGPPPSRVRSPGRRGGASVGSQAPGLPEPGDAMRGSSTPILLLLLALLVVGAAVYFALKPATSSTLEVAGPPDGTQGHSGPDRTSTVPDAAPGPSRTTVRTTPRDEVRGGNDGGSYAHAIVGA